MTKKPTLLGGIKAKLISATCMLLVAVIMVVSSTYAWFTLSTAPEVTGITTAVGANGALEMALFTGDTNIKTSSGAILSGEDINTYWGNLVDLSDASYGLQHIVLYPSVLNAGDGNALNTTNFLLTPTYGADGRVSALEAKAVTGMYDATAKGFLAITQDGDYGVRALGIASGMTPRQHAYRNATADASTAMSKAQFVEEYNKYDPYCIWPDTIDVLVTDDETVDKHGQPAGNYGIATDDEKVLRR
jgi:hypothetical protein